MNDDYAPVTFADEDEEEQRRKDEPYPPVQPVMTESSGAAMPISTDLPAAPIQLGSPSRMPRLAASPTEGDIPAPTPTMTAAPAPDMSVPPVMPMRPARSAPTDASAAPPMPRLGMTPAPDLGNAPGVMPTRQPSPAESRMRALLDQGPPPVQPLHGWKKGLDIAGKIIAPEAEQAIRYGPQHEYAANLGQAEAGLKAESANFAHPYEEQTAQLKPQEEAAKVGQEQGKESEERATAESKLHPQETWKAVPGMIGPGGKVLQESTQGNMRWAPDIEGAGPIKQPGETQEQNKLGFQGIVSKLDKAGLSTDPKTLDKSLDKALQQKNITPEEHAAARSYMAANPNAATNLTVHLTGQEEGNKLAIDKMFEGSEVIAHMPDGRRVQMSYADAKAQGVPAERLVKLNPKEAQDNRDKQASVQTTFKGLDRYRRDFKTSAPNLTTTDRDALRVLAAHNQSGATGGLIAGFIDDLPLAGPLSQYVNKLAEGTMTSDQYKQLSPAGKKLVSDYFTSIIDNFANMKAVMGTVGRNPQMLQAEVNTVPVPYLDWESAAIQFENKRASLQGRAGSMPELYTPGQK
jgi:hypothetical protein